MLHWALFDQKSLGEKDYVELFTWLPRTCEKQRDVMTSHCSGARASRQLLSNPCCGLAPEPMFISWTGPLELGSTYFFILFEEDWGRLRMRQNFVSWCCPAEHSGRTSRSIIDQKKTLNYSRPVFNPHLWFLLFLCIFTLYLLVCSPLILLYWFFSSFAVPSFPFVLFPSLFVLSSPSFPLLFMFPFFSFMLQLLIHFFFLSFRIVNWQK